MITSNQTAFILSSQESYKSKNCHLFLQQNTTAILILTTQISSTPFPLDYTQQHYNNNNVDPDLIRAKQVMTVGFCGCLEDPVGLLLAWFCSCCLFGLNYSESGQGPCLLGGCCMPFLCGTSRSHIYKLVGAQDQDPGCPINCLIHACFPLRVFAIAQEYNAITHLKRAQLRGHYPQQYQQSLAM